jgi:two-component system, NtrC family, C4-dicarboxylate transport sensor histidine kinase DctB
MMIQTKTIQTKQNGNEFCEQQLDVGGLVRHLAHEIANPLNAVMMNAEMARSLIDRGDTARASEILERLLGDCARCGKLMRDMQNFGGSLCEHEPISLSVSELVDGATSTIVFEYEGTLPIFNVDAKGFTLNVDRAAMERALIALLRNAGEAGATEVSIVASKNKNKICIDIRDDGVGLDEKGLQKLSGFYSTKRAAGGMGLGIALAREIVRKNGGTLSVRANSPKGLHVSIGLPASG